MWWSFVVFYMLVVVDVVVTDAGVAVVVV